MLRVAFQALPPDVPIVGEGHVGEQGIARFHGLHGVRVGAVVGAGCHAEETELGVGGVEAAVLTEAQPGDIVAHDLGFPAINGGLQHGEVGLAAGRGERGGHVVGLAFGGGELQDEHVLRQPAFIVGHYRGDTQGIALLCQDSVAAVAGTVRPNLAGFGELRNVLGVVAGPRNVFFTWFKRRTHGVQAAHELALLTNRIQGFLAHAGHNAHRHHHIGGIRQLNTQLRVRGVIRTHAERHHIHGAALHGTTVMLSHLGLHGHRVGPVIGGACAFFSFGADERAGFHTCHVGGVGARQETIGAFFLVEADKCAGFHELRG